MHASSELSATAYPRVQRILRGWPGYARLASLMEQHEDLQIYLAGGAVRGCLIEAAPTTKDFDFFFAGPSVDSALNQLRQHGRWTQTPYGSPRWFPSAASSGNADVIPIHEFKPGLWPCEDIVDVLNQFDFTMNAVACDIRTGEFFDPQNGARDIERRSLRMIRFDYPEDPFVPGAAITRNAVLWFRALHYASSLRFAIEPLTFEWLRSRVSYEHLAREFEDVFFPLDSGYLSSLRIREHS